MFSKAAKNRRRDFKKGIDNDDARRKREENQDLIRKSKREEQIAKRRQRAVGQQAEPDQPAHGRDPAVEQKLAHIPELVQAVHSQDAAHVLNAVQQFRKLLSIERDPPIQEVIDCGIVPKLVEFLAFHRNHMLQFEAAWALTNIASGTTRHTRVVIENNAVPLFVQQLRSPNADVREQAVWALGNIAGDSQQCRDLVLQAGAMQPLLALCTVDAKLSMLRNATWTLSNFCRGKPQPAFDLVSPALPTLAQLIYHKDDEVLTDACWALSYLSDDTGPNNAKIQAVLQSGVARRLVELLLHQSPNVKTPALRTVGNIVTGDDLQTQVILNCSVLPALLSLLNSPKRGIRKETCWTISNITAGNPDQIAAVIRANIIPPLIATLRNAEFDIQKEAAWAISNATSGGSDDQIRFLVEQGAIHPLCELLKCPDSKIIMVALEGLENILRVGKADAPKFGNTNKFAEYIEECDGLTAIEGLQNNANDKIYNKAVQILTTYFDSEEEDSSLAPAVDNNQFQFSAPTPGNQTYKFS